MPNFSTYNGLTEGGRAKYTLPFDGGLFYMPVPKRYAEYPELWRDPAVEYPWVKPACQVSAEGEDRSLIRPETHVEYVVILRTLQRTGKLRKTPGTRQSATEVLFKRMPLKPLDDRALAERVRRLSRFNLVEIKKNSPADRKYASLKLTDEGLRFVKSWTIPELPQDLVDEQVAREAAEQVEAASVGEPVVEDREDAVVSSLPLAAAPPVVGLRAKDVVVDPDFIPGRGQPVYIVEDRDEPEGPVDFHAIGVGVMSAYGEALERIEQFENDEGNAAHLRLQLEESQRQVKQLTERLQKTEELAQRYLTERNNAASEALTATRNLEETMKSVRALPKSGRVQRGLDEMMKRPRER